MNWNKISQWFELVGLVLLLFSFGWQCLEEHTNQKIMEGYVYELNEKIFCVWEGIYDEALHSDRYNGNATVSLNYDALNTQIRDWKQVKSSSSTFNKQENTFFSIRVVLYTLGTLLIIVAKLPKRNSSING